MCKKVLDEENSSIAVLCIIWSIISRISNISNAATKLTQQIEDILKSLNQKKAQIEREYQIPINTIYSDSLTAKLINLSEEKPNKFNGDYCWILFARHLTNAIEASTIFDAKLTPALENILKEDDIRRFKDFLQNTQDSKTRMDTALNKCRNQQSEAQQYTKLLEFVKDLLKIEE